MKKLFAVSCATLLASIIIVPMAVTTAFAEEDTSSGIIFPAEETIEYTIGFNGVNDYAVTYYTEPGTDVSYYRYAFANNTGVVIYSCYDGENEVTLSYETYLVECNTPLSYGKYDGGTIETIEKIGNSSFVAIDNIEYAENGDLYFKDAYGLYVIRSGETAPEEVDPSKDDFDDFKDYGEYEGLVSETSSENTYLYEITGDGKLYVFNKDSPEDSGYLGCDDETFTGLKKIDDIVYVLGNTLYILENGQSLPLSFMYEDFDTALSILVADTYELLLKTGEKIYCAAIDADALLIPVDLDNPITDAYADKTYFSTSRICRFADIQKEEGTSFAHILIESGNATLICYGKKTYLVNTDNINKIAYTASPLQDVYYSLDDVNVYSVPYPAGSTKIGTLEKSSEISVTGAVENSEISFYDGFYEIEYENASGETVKGYVLSSMVSEYSFDDDNPEMISAELVEASYGNNVTLCVVIMVLAAVLLIAAIYLTLVLTSGKRKK